MAMKLTTTVVIVESVRKGVHHWFHRSHAIWLYAMRAAGNKSVETVRHAAATATADSFLDVLSAQVKPFKITSSIEPHCIEKR